jgi:carboxypeptidase C (cathepsin A)
MFSFNGGPGSSSVWLHLGALGPKRVKMLDDGALPPPPYQLVENEHTWLEFTDLVFIDPVGTGFSRPRNRQLGQRFWSLPGDIESVGEFIRMYLTRHQRWTSPLFLVGESYGTTRAAGLAGHLVDRGIAFNGVLLISAVLNFQGLQWTKGNDLPAIVYLPTYTAAAWYHKKLPPDLQKSLKGALAEAEEYAVHGYAQALAKGDTLSAAERQAVIAKLARLTGLDRRFIDQNDLRIENNRFCKELLRDEKRTIGRLDGRFKGWDAPGAGERPEFDPSMAAIRPPYTATFADYVRRELGYKTDATYHILGGGIGQWDFGAGGRQGFADTSEALRSALAKNPYMKVFLGEGYYDFATPYFGARYTVQHMGLDPAVRGNITSAQYEAGHMMYIDLASLAKLKKDVAAFVAAAVSPARRP